MTPRSKDLITNITTNIVYFVKNLFEPPGWDGAQRKLGLDKAIIANSDTSTRQK